MASVELFGRLIVSLVVIGGLVLLARRALQGRFSLDRSAPGIEVLARRQLGPKVGLVLVRCGMQTLLLGTEGERITLLSSGDDLATGATAGDARTPNDDVAIDLAGLEALAAPRRPALAAAPAADGATFSVDEVLGDLVGTPSDRRDADRPTPTGLRDTGRILEQMLGERSTERTTGARMRQSGPRSAPTRMSVIEALREVTVRKG